MAKYRRFIIAFVITRALLTAAGLAAPHVLPFHADYSKGAFHYGRDAPRALDVWARWDSEWYLYIADQGYDTQLFPSHYRNATAGFFPLYPLLVRFSAAVLGRSLIAGLLVSNLSLLAFGLILLKIAEALGLSAAEGERAARYYLVFPASFFLSCVYSESLFLALSAGCVLAGMKKRWWAAGLLGGLAALTRPVGLFLVAPLAWLYAGDLSSSKRRPGAEAAALLLVPLGTAVFAAFCRWKFGDALEFFARQTLWRMGAEAPWTVFARFLESEPRLLDMYNSWTDFAAAALALLSLPLIFKRLGAALGLYAALLVIAPLASSLMSFQRLLLASFPHFLLIGTLTRNAVADRVLTAALAAGLLGYFAVFSQWGWVG